MDYFKILPEEITLDILTRLPTESVLDSKLVCTSWRDLVSHHPLFSKMHLYRLNHPAVAHSGKLGFLALTNDYIFHHFEYNDEDNNESTIQRISRFNFTPPIHGAGFVGSCNGLIYLLDPYSYSSVCICNPVTREYVRLPKIITYCVGFGYVSKTNQYKIVGMHMPMKPHYESVEPQFVEVHIYTLGSGNGWRNLGNFDFEFNHRNQFEAGISVNGALYWLDTKLEMIVTFDLAEEQFSQHISLPSLPPNFYRWYSIVMMDLDGFLSFAIYHFVESVMVNDIWLLKKKNDSHDMKEGEENQTLVWSKEFRIDITTLFAVTKSGCVLAYGYNYLSIYETNSLTSKRLVKFKRPFFQVCAHQNTFVSLKELGEEDIKVLDSVEIEETRSRDYSFEHLQEDGEP